MTKTETAVAFLADTVASYEGFGGLDKLACPHLDAVVDVLETAGFATVAEALLVAHADVAQPDCHHQDE